MLKYRQVVELLRQRICNGEYPDGTLPAIRQLAEDLGVSYLTARKAVKELKESGIIAHNASNRKIVIDQTVTKHPLVGVITPLWRFSEWMRAIRNVTAELGGQSRFVTYASDTDPVITEMLSGNFDVILVELPTRRRPDRLLDRLRKLGSRAVVLFHDMSRYGLRSFVCSSPEYIRLFMERLRRCGCRRIDALGSANSGDLECAARLRAWRSFLTRHRLEGECHDPGILPFEHPELKVWQLALRLIDSGRLPEAVFCLTPALAIGFYRYAPSEPHGEEEEGFFRVGIYQKDECRRAMMTARRHFPLHNNEPELIDYFVSPLGSANQSVPPEWNSNEAEHLRATCESRCRSLCMSRRTNTG